MKTVLVTGVAGFIGSHLSRRLLKEGYIVLGLDNLSAGKFSTFQELSNIKNFIPIVMDIRDDLTELFTKYKISYIFNQAASKKNICIIDPKKDMKVNGIGTLNLLQMANKFEVEKFIHASTGSVYGEAEIFPSNEHHPLKPQSYYGVSKLAGERYVSMFNKEYNLNTTILRYYHVYGSGQEDRDDLGGVVAIFSKKMKEGNPISIFGTGNQLRSFTHVDDIVESNIQAITNGNGGVFNIASGMQVTIYELAKILAKHFKVELDVVMKPRMEGDIDYFKVDNRKAIEELKMTFQTKLNLKGL